jgi:hypothetical protein
MDKRSLTRLAISGIIMGGLALAGCESSTSPKTEAVAPTLTSAKTALEFETACTAAKGMYKAHDCEGMNTCKGHSFQEGKGIATHDCTGKSSCKGGSCVES